jgi:thioredoxin 1
LGADYLASEPTREEVDALPGSTLLEFGTPWCGWCRRAQPLIANALAAHPGVRHIKVADASGKPLGRSFGVKLWPTLVFLRDGKEVARLVRPADARSIGAALAQIDAKADRP